MNLFGKLFQRGGEKSGSVFVDVDLRGEATKTLHQLDNEYGRNGTIHIIDGDASRLSSDGLTALARLFPQKEPLEDLNPRGPNVRPLLGGRGKLETF